METLITEWDIRRVVWWKGEVGWEPSTSGWKVKKRSRCLKEVGTNWETIPMELLRSTTHARVRHKLSSMDEKTSTWLQAQVDWVSSRASPGAVDEPRNTEWSETRRHHETITYRQFLMNTHQQAMSAHPRAAARWASDNLSIRKWVPSPSVSLMMKTQRKHHTFHHLD